MNRVQKKCLIVSLGIHLSLVVLLIVGPAFLPSEPKLDASQILTFIPTVTTDDHVSGGGSPTAPPPPRAPEPQPPQPETPPPQPVTPPPQPQPRPEPRPIEPVKQPEPEPPKIERPSPDAFEPVKRHKHVIEVNDKLVTSTSTDIKAARAKELAKERADARRRAAEVSRAMASLKGDFSPSTSVKVDFGPGGGGPAYANFYSAVTTVYYNAWRQPNGVPNLTVKVSVTIARDGTVLSARILKPSGNSTVDNSVQETIDRVKFVVPLPPDSKEDSREVTVNFSTQSIATG